jgi:2-dehydro-3-deoxy-D-arabinonate dehydratase
MKLCRFRLHDDTVRVGLVTDDQNVLDLTAGGVARLDELLAEKNLTKRLTKLKGSKLPSHPLAQVKFLAPVDQQEVWAVGVTYLRSMVARKAESDFSATAYDRVYDAARPELFFKSLPHRVVGPGANVGIRRDAKWNVPEPELVLVFNPRGELVGYTIGNDMSSRDIGPWIVVGVKEKVARQWDIHLSIRRRGKEVFTGDTSVSRIKRTFGELQEYLFRSQTLSHGAMLLTGTGIVPTDAFTLQTADKITISISGIGELTNPVAVV